MRPRVVIYPILKNIIVIKRGINTPIGENHTKCLKKLIPAKIRGRIKRM
jgi:hypothetical protein